MQLKKCAFHFYQQQIILNYKKKRVGKRGRQIQAQNIYSLRSS